MTTSSYEEALRRLLAHEGGYTNHPADPGGPTNFGITIYDYRKYVKPDATAADVRAMPLADAKCIYRAKYWDAQRCDELPAGVDYAVFDYGVNSGIGRAGKVLRGLVALSDKTSAITNEVIAAATRCEPRTLIDAICDERLAFLQGLRTWSVFGNGWGRRVREVQSGARAMAAKGKRSQPQAGPAREPTSPVIAAKARKPPVAVTKKVGIGAAIVAAFGAAAHWIDQHPFLAIGAVVLAGTVASIVLHRFAKGD